STPTSTLASVSSSPLSASIVATATLSAASATSTDYETVVLYQHNIHRANHSASDFVWNSTLASIAQEIGETCIYEHNTEVGGGGYGQNIGAGWSAAEVGAMITDAMYNDEMMNFQDLYGEANPNMTNFEHWGHFSQIVWKNSASVGCATVLCDELENFGSNSSFTVCNFYPAGNYAGEYGDNVGEPLGDAM
ncbi:PR-1-like protein, partial [Fistulina hepatica ATCC 64428]